VSCGAPVNFGRRQSAVCPKKIGGGAVWVAKRTFSKIPENNSVLSSKFSTDFLMTFFSHRKLQQNNYASTMASAARRQIIAAVTTYSRVHHD